MDLMSRIQYFVKLQVALIAALKETLGPCDWALLLDVPSRGKVNIDGADWEFTRHGTGIRFERDGVTVDANRHLEAEPGIFDVGRLVDYFDSVGDRVVLVNGKTHEFDYDSGGELLRELSVRGEIDRAVGLTGEVFVLRAQ